VSRRPLFAFATFLTSAAVVLAGAPAFAEVPYPAAPAGGDPYAYPTYLHTDPSSPPPKDLQPSSGEAWKYSSKTACQLYGVGDPHCTPQTQKNALDPQELYGVTGASVDLAWQKTTGRPDVVIGNVDSGFDYSDKNALEDANNKFYVNTGELPEPQWGTRDPAHPYDRDHNGVVDIRDWCPDWHDAKDCGGKGDPTLRGNAGTDDTDLNKNGLIDIEDMILKFSDGTDADGDGYVDNISGWDTYEGDNDPYDEFHYGHGTGEARDSSGEADNDGGAVGTCPNCRIMVLRVGDSFIADTNSFAQAVLFATDTGANLIQSALGTLNNSQFAQQAVDYAYRRGVALVASAADESAGHHNQPSELEHASVFNAIGEPQTDVTNLPGNTASATGSYLQFRGCTNYGAYITASVPANSCSSEAVGRSAGMAGLAYSAAKNALAQGKIQDYGVLDGPAGVPAGGAISAEELHQLIATTADDINFVTPRDKQQETDVPIASQRYPATAGWDPFFGYGRINANSIVSAVTSNAIPPEAYIDSPKWYATVPTTAPIRVMGSVAARRASSYDVKVEWAPWSWRDTNAAPSYSTAGVTLTVPHGTSPQSGLLATIDPAVVKAALDQADTSAPGLGKGTSGPAVDPVTGRGDHENRQIPDKFGVILRLTVTAATQTTAGLKTLTGIATKDMNLHDDPALLPGFPKDLLGDGAAAPRFADLNDDGKDELVVATSNGLIHAYEADGSELPGWPVHTTVMPSAALPTAKAYNSGEITTPIYSATLRPPAIGDINRDGHLEVVVPDFAGRITAFDRFGSVLPGFPVRSNPAYSSPQPADRAAGFYANSPGAVPGDYPRAGEALPNDPDREPDLVNRRSQSNRTSWWFLAAPTLSDIDPSYPGLEIVEGAGDRHVYAWHADGTPVPGWPVMLRDPSLVDDVNPFTHEITQKAGTHVYNGAKIVTSPSIGDLDGDGKLDIVIAPNEQYQETEDSDDAAVSNPITGQVLSGGNDRLYNLYADGSRHGAGPGTPANRFPNANAFQPGWPAKLSTKFLELLPVVGDGPTGSAVIGNIDGGNDLEVADYGTAGPIHLLKSTGEPVLGRDSQGRQSVLQTGVTGPASNSKDTPSIPAAGGGILVDLDKDGHLDVAAGSVGLGKALDLVLPDDQLLSDNHLGVWSTDPNGTRGQLPAFPRETNDLHFLSTPSAADVNGDGSEEILDGTAYSDLHAFSSTGDEPGLKTLDDTGWPKFTGGWTVVAPAVGDLLGDGTRIVASTTREGSLFAWRTTAKSCDLASWPEWGHDGWNTSNVTTDAVRPARVDDLAADYAGGRTTLHFTAVGDDGRCGTATTYDLRASADPITDANFASATPIPIAPPKSAGTAESFTPSLPPTARYLALRVYDADPATATPVHPANLSALATVAIAGLAPSASPTPSGSGGPGSGGAPGPGGSPGAGGSGFHRLTPSRLLDTRTGTGSPVVAGADRLVSVTGHAGVPTSGVSAVVVNATVTDVSAPMDLEVYPSGSKPTTRTSNLNAVRGQTVANLVTVAVGPDGRIGLSLSQGRSDVVLDVLGWYSAPSDASGDGYVSQVPDRRFDSRDSSPISAGSDRVVPLFSGAAPSGISSAVVSLTALHTTGNADIELYAAGSPPARRTSNLNLRKGQTVANLAVVPVDSSGRVEVSVSKGSADVAIDLVGWFANGAPRRYTPLTPARIYDSRPSSRVTTGNDREVGVLGMGGVPSSGVDAVLVNVTSVGSTTPADLEVYPAGSPPSRRTSNLNVVAGQTVPVLVVAKVGSNGKVALSTSQGSMHVVLDVVGWIASG
jgi:hypothetical protein